jgi:hypothetical protein
MRRERSREGALRARLRMPVVVLVPSRWSH